MRAKHITVILAFAVMSVLSACSGDKDGSLSDPGITESSTSTSAVTSSVTTTASAEPEPEPDDSEKYRLSDKLTYLNCIGEGQKITDLGSIGDGRLVALHWQFEDEITDIMVIDILEDKIVAKSRVDGCPAFESVTDGGFILRDSDKSEFCFFDDELNVLKTYKPEKFFGKFSPDGKKYYQIVCGKLYCEDVDSGSLTHIRTNADLDFSGTIEKISSDGKYIDLQYDKYTDGDFEATAAVRIDLNKNAADMISYDISYPAYSENYIYARIYDDDDDYLGRLYRISHDGSECIVFDDDRYYLESISDSDYLMCEEISENGYPKKYLARFDDSGKCYMSQLNDEYPEGYLGCLTYMPKEDLVAFCIGNDDSDRICLAEPSLLELSNEIGYEEAEAPVLYDEKIYEDYLTASKIPECPEYLAPLRKRADELEEQYGLKIYMSAECRNMVTEIAYDCTDEAFNSEGEYLNLELALDEVEAALEKYPEDFLRQFRFSTGDGGLRICLTSYIHDGFSAAYAVVTGDWYNIVMNISHNCEGNLAHELWHSTESRICDKDPSLLSEAQWMTFNPDGFEYSDEYKIDSTGVGEYCFSYADDWYFYDNYSKVNSCEDKARIMEIIMNPMMFPSDEFAASEHIMKKLDCMKAAVRQTFDTSSWGDDVFWERFS